MFDSLTQLVGDASGWAYAIVFLFAFVDLFSPLVPSETAVITGGVVAAAGDLTLALVVPAAAGGAFLGDNTAYVLGRRLRDWVVGRFFRGEKGRSKLEWAQGQLRERGGAMIVTARFVPGGRTVVTLSAGMFGLSRRRFVVADALAAVVWAVASSLLGYFGGRVFEHSAWGLVFALGLGFSLGALAEGVRWLSRRRRAARVDVRSPAPRRV